MNRAEAAEKDWNKDQGHSIGRRSQGTFLHDPQCRCHPRSDHSRTAEASDVAGCELQSHSIAEDCRVCYQRSSQVPSLNPPPGILKVAINVRIEQPIAIIASIIGPPLAVIALSNGALAQSAPYAAPTACQIRLSEDRAVFKPLGGLDGPAECGGPDIVLLERIILADRSEVAIEPPATLRCEMAEAVVSFVRQDLAPAAAAMGSALSAIENFDSYDCRGRNRVAGAKLSEHGLANALDIRSVRLKDGRVVRPADAGAPSEFRFAMKAAVCSRFTTVLGPGSDGYHEDHIHIDRIERRGGYRLCQWDLRDELRSYALQSVTPSRAHAAAVLVPLPRPRPFAAAGARSVLLPEESRP